MRSESKKTDSYIGKTKSYALIFQPGNLPIVWYRELSQITSNWSYCQKRIAEYRRKLKKALVRMNDSEKRLIAPSGYWMEFFLVALSQGSYAYTTDLEKRFCSAVCF